MPERPTIRLHAPLTDARTVPGPADAEDAGPDAAAEAARRALETERGALARAAQALERAAAGLSDLQDTIAREAEAHLAELAVAIARKVLKQAVDAGQYDVEAIVQEALRCAPSRREVVVRLNPEDLARIEKAGAEGKPLGLGGVRLAADPALGRAECAVDTAEGTVDVRLEDQLQEVRQALAGSPSP
jgi:flagellar assembly protein FliH